MNPLIRLSPSTLCILATVRALLPAAIVVVVALAVLAILAAREDTTRR